MCFFAVWIKFILVNILSLNHLLLSIYLIHLSSWLLYLLQQLLSFILAGIFIPMLLWLFYGLYLYSYPAEYLSRLFLQLNHLKCYIYLFLLQCFSLEKMAVFLYILQKIHYMLPYYPPINLCWLLLIHACLHLPLPHLK